MKSFTEKPSVTKAIEKQVIKEAAKESGKLEKHEKLEKSEKDKHEKEKNEKEVKERKESKEKLEKEKSEKHEKNEKSEKEKHEKEIKDHKHEGKEGKEKEHKVEALEKVQKDVEVMQPAEFGYSADPESQTAELQPAKNIEKFAEKVWYFEKPTHKEFKYEKIEHKEWDKYIEIGNIPDPGDPLQATTETRLAALEANIAQLMHFIPENLRPDLSQGALKGEGTKEPAAADASSSEKPEPTPAKEADKGKKA